MSLTHIISRIKKLMAKGIIVAILAISFLVTNADSQIWTAARAMYQDTPVPIKYILTRVDVIGESDEIGSQDRRIREKLNDLAYQLAKSTLEKDARYIVIKPSHWPKDVDKSSVFEWSVNVILDKGEGVLLGQVDNVVILETKFGRMAWPISYPYQAFERPRVIAVSPNGPALLSAFEKAIRPIYERERTRLICWNAANLQTDQCKKY